MPINAHRMRWYQCGIMRWIGRRKMMPTSWSGSSTSVSVRKVMAIRTTRIMTYVGNGPACTCPENVDTGPQMGTRAIVTSYRELCGIAKGQTRPDDRGGCQKKCGPGQ